MVLQDRMGLRMLKVVYLQRIHLFCEKINYVMGYKINYNLQPIGVIKVKLPR